MREFAEKAQGECRNAEEGGPAKGAREGRREVGIAHGPGSAGIQRAAEIEVFEGEEGEHRFILEMDPAHPLMAVAKRSAEASAKEGHERAQGAAAVAEDERRAEEDDAALLRPNRFGFPIAHDAREEIVIRRAAFRDLGFARVAIQSDAGTTNQDLGRLCAGVDCLDDTAGTEHAAIANAALAARRPEPGH